MEALDGISMERWQIFSVIKVTTEQSGLWHEEINAQHFTEITSITKIQHCFNHFFRNTSQRPDQHRPKWQVFSESLSLKTNILVVSKFWLSSSLGIHTAWQTLLQKNSYSHQLKRWVVFRIKWMSNMGNLHVKLYILPDKFL